MKLPKKSKFKPVQHWVIIAFLLAVYDFVAVVASYTLALFVRFDFVFSRIGPKYWQMHLKIIAPYALVCIILFYLFKLYHSMWRFASYHELARAVMANSVAVAAFVAVTLLASYRMPISYYLVGGVCQFGFTIAIRFAYRFLLLFKTRNSRGHFQNRVLLIGAGVAGQMILREVINGGSDAEDKICAIIDDNPNKWNRYVDNIKIVGGRESIFSAVEEYKINKIFFAIPTASPEDRREILNICSETGCELKQLPGMYQLITDEVHVSSLKEVAIEDLLGREPIKVNMSEVFDFIHGKTILVTGGGGSIGSEICRQVAAHDPKQLIIFDVYENNAYDIQLELRDRFMTGISISLWKLYVLTDVECHIRNLHGSMIITDGGKPVLCKIAARGPGCRSMKILSGTLHRGIFRRNISIIELYGMRFIALHRGSEPGRPK